METLRRLIARGFEPEPDPPIEPVWLARDGAGHPVPVPGPEARAAVAAEPADVLCALLPTYVSRCSREEHLVICEHAALRLREVPAALPGITPVLIVGMQHAPGEEREALDRLAEMGRRLAAAGPLPRFLGLALPGPGKRRTINVALRLLGSASNVRGWIWLDDDTRMEPECLARLAGRFLARGGHGAVGATVVRLADASRPSGWLRRVKRVTRPRRSYPQSCCMVVETGVLAAGIPERRFSDDGFVFFELLDPAREDPYGELEVLAEARCSTYVGGGLRDTVRNLRRSLYSHILCMADYPPAKARFYFRHSLFHGLWPLAPWAGGRKWLAKALHFAWFCGVAAKLALRGVAGRPLRRVEWGAYSRYRLPPAAG
jgi:hypothetical protein